MKPYILLIAIICNSFYGYSQIHKMEVFQVGTKLAFYAGQCDNNIPQSEGKLSFCDDGGNLGIVERSYGLSDRGIKRMFANHQNQDEVYLTRNGISIWNMDGTWENIPNVAVPQYNGSVLITEGIVTPSGKLIFSSTNGQSKMTVYNRSTKEISTESFPVGVYPNLFVYDDDENLTWILAKQSNKIYLYSYDEISLVEIAQFTEPGFIAINQGYPIKYRANHIYIGNGNGLFDLDISNYSSSVPLTHYNTTSTPSLPYDRVNDFHFAADGKLWVAMTASYDGALIEFNTLNGDYNKYQLPLESNPDINLRFRTLAIDESTGFLWAAASNYNGLVNLQFNGSIPNWAYLPKDSLSILGFPYTYAPDNIYYRNNQFYFTTVDYSSSSNENFEVLINKNGSWSGHSDNDDGNLSTYMNKRFKYSAPDDVGGVWWFNTADHIVVYRDKDDNHQYINLNIGPSNVVDVDQKAIVYGSPNGLQKIDFPNTVPFLQAPNSATGLQRVGSQVWIYDRIAKKIDVYENNNLEKTYDLGNDDYQYYYRFAVDDENNVWFMRSNGTGGNYIRKFNTATLVAETFDRPEKLNSHLVIVPGPESSVWFVGRKGLLLYKDGSWYPFVNSEYPEFFNVIDAIVDENGKCYVLRSNLAAITTIENPTAVLPVLNTTFLEGGNTILPALKHYAPAVITIDSEGSVWTHGSQNAFKIVDDDLAREYRVPLVVANENLLFDSDVELYPNPSNGTLFVKTNLDIDKIEIYSVLGRLVESIFNRHAMEIDLPSGVYSVKVFSGKKTVVKKLIIN